MSVKILSEYAISFERTLVYQTVFENFVVPIQQKRKNDLWYTYQHCLIPKLFINAIAALPEKNGAGWIQYHYFWRTLTTKKLYHKCIRLKKLCRRKWDVSCTDTTAIVCPYSRINSVHIKPTKIWVICGVSNHHHPHRTVSHRVFQSVFQQLLLWIQAQILLQPQAPHSLRISRGRTRSLTILQIQVRLMSIFYLVQTFRHHNPRQIQPMSRHPIARKLQ